MSPDVKRRHTVEYHPCEFDSHANIIAHVFHLWFLFIQVFLNFRVTSIHFRIYVQCFYLLKLVIQLSEPYLLTVFLYVLKLIIQLPEPIMTQTWYITYNFFDQHTLPRYDMNKYIIFVIFNFVVHHLSFRLMAIQLRRSASVYCIILHTNSFIFYSGFVISFYFFIFLQRNYIELCGLGIRE